MYNRWSQIAFHTQLLGGIVSKKYWVEIWKQLSCSLELWQQPYCVHDKQTIFNIDPHLYFSKSSTGGRRSALNFSVMMMVPARMVKMHIVTRCLLEILFMIVTRFWGAHLFIVRMRTLYELLIVMIIMWHRVSHFVGIQRPHKKGGLLIRRRHTNEEH